jgi:hypothetical protein
MCDRKLDCGSNCNYDLRMMFLWHFNQIFWNRRRFDLMFVEVGIVGNFGGCQCKAGEVYSKLFHLCVFACSLKKFLCVYMIDFMSFRFFVIFLDAVWASVRWKQRFENKVLYWRNSVIFLNFLIKKRGIFLEKVPLKEILPPRC